MIPPAIVASVRRDREPARRFDFGLWSVRAFLVLVAVFGLCPSPGVGQEAKEGDVAGGMSTSVEPPASIAPAPLPPLNILLRDDGDVEALWRALERPDYRILRAVEPLNLSEGGSGSSGAGGSGGGGSVSAVWTIQSLEIRGVVPENGAFADVSVRIEALGPPGVSGWLPVRLDGRNLVSARERDRELAAREAPRGSAPELPLPIGVREAGRGWSVQLPPSSESSRLVEIRLPVPVRSTPEGLSLELAIPEAPSTRLELSMGGRVASASLGPDQPLPVEAVPPDLESRPDLPEIASRVSARVTPRANLSVSWTPRVEEDRAALPALLTAEGTVELRVDLASAQTLATWDLTCERGRLSEIRFRLDPDEELLVLKIENQAIPFDTLREPGARAGQPGSILVRVPLASPLRRGETRRVALTTRRAALRDGVRGESGGGAEARFSFQGPRFESALEHRGLLFLTRSDPELWINANPRSGLVEIPLAEEIPAEFREIDGFAAGYRFNAPYELRANVGPAPARFTLARRARVELSPEDALVRAQWVVSVVQGRPLSIRARVPRGVRVLRVGPTNLVRNYAVTPDEARVEGGGAGSEGADSGSGLEEGEGDATLVVNLAEEARALSNFTLDILARQSFGPPPEALGGVREGSGSGSGTEVAAAPRRLLLGLVTPLDGIAVSHLLEVVGSEKLAPELDEDRTTALSFQTLPSAPPRDWPWARPHPAIPLLLLRDPAATANRVPVIERPVPLDFEHRSRVDVFVEAERSRVYQESVLTVRSGALRAFHVAAEEGWVGDWTFDSATGFRTEPAGADSSGRPLVRVVFDEPVTESARFRFRLPRAGAPPSPPGALVPPRLRIVEGRERSLEFQIGAAPGLALLPDLDDDRHGHWRIRQPSPEETLADPPDQLASLAFRADAPPAGGADPAVEVRTATAAALPDTVADRVWIRTVRLPDGASRGMLLMHLDKHPRAFDLRVPPGTRLERILVGNLPVAALETLPDNVARVRFPTDAPIGPATVIVEFSRPASASSPNPAGGEAPALVSGAVQRVFWEALAPSSEVVLFPPSDWNDENEWVRRGASFRRQSRLRPDVLYAWLRGDVEAMPADTRTRLIEEQGSYTSLLYGRSGSPAPLRLRSMPSSLLVALDAAAILGLGILALRAPGWRPLALAVAVLAPPTLALAEPNAAALALIHAPFGLLLLGLAAYMQWSYDRRKSRAEQTPGAYGSVEDYHPDLLPADQVSPAEGAGAGLVAVADADADAGADGGPGSVSGGGPAELPPTLTVPPPGGPAQPQAQPHIALEPADPDHQPTRVRAADHRV